MEKTTMTKVEILEFIKSECAKHDFVVEFCENEIGMLARKAEKAKARAAEKKAKGDEIYACVVNCLSATPLTIEAVYDMLSDDPELTVGKVRARLSQAVKNGVAAKDKTRIDGKDKTVYTRAN